MKRKTTAFLVSIFSLLTFIAIPASAHVIVSPHQVGIAATQDFTVSVPNEKDNPVTSVKLIIPKGLTDVVPNVIAGWTITTKTKSTAVTEIDWKDGSIPVGQREEFIFQAQAPSEPTTLSWKAYQTYSDGTVVSWDVNPATMEKLSDTQQDTIADKENRGEYSTTQVINDLTNNGTSADSSEKGNTQATIFSIAALVISILALTALNLRKKKDNN